MFYENHNKLYSWVVSKEEIPTERILNRTRHLGLFSIHLATVANFVFDLEIDTTYANAGESLPF